MMVTGRGMFVLCLVRRLVPGQPCLVRAACWDTPGDRGDSVGAISDTRQSRALVGQSCVRTVLLAMLFVLVATLSLVRS